jgi:hypothetical protein
VAVLAGAVFAAAGATVAATLLRARLQAPVHDEVAGSPAFAEAE